MVIDVCAVLKQCCSLCNIKYWWHSIEKNLKYNKKIKAEYSIKTKTCGVNWLWNFVELIFEKLLNTSDSPLASASPTMVYLIEVKECLTIDSGIFFQDIGTDCARFDSDIFVIIV